MSVLNDVLDEVVRLQRRFAPALGDKQLAVVKRALPKREETVDPEYQVTVNAAEQPEDCARLGFGDKWRVVYSVEITLISPNERDMLTGLVEHTEWREVSRTVYMGQRPLAAVSAVKGVEVVKSPMLPRSKLAQGYNYNQVSLIVTTYESR